jgi:endonuclease YncB( thermonuclease family)
MKKILFLLFITIIFSCNNKHVKPQNVNEFTAKVIGVKDGDTIEVLYKNNPTVIRFEHIDCPQKNHLFWWLFYAFYLPLRETVRFNNQSVVT